MEEPSNFGELKSKASEWNHALEETFINKLKTFCTTYETKCNNLSLNLSNFSRNLALIEIDYFNTIDSLKIISLQKFVEHLIDKDDVCPKKIDLTIESEHLMTSEEKNSLLLQNIQKSIQSSLKALPQREIKADGDCQSVYEDNVSVASSKIFSNQIERMYRNLRLPHVIGTKEFKVMSNLGLIQEINEQDDEIQNDLKVVGLVRESEDLNYPNNDIRMSNNIVKIKGTNIPVPPPMNLTDQQIQNFKRQNQGKKDEQLKNNAVDAQVDQIPYENKKEVIENDIKQQPKDFNSLLKDQMEANGRSMLQRNNDDDNSLQASLRKSQPLFLSNHSSSIRNQLGDNEMNKPSPQLHNTMTMLNQNTGSANKKGISLNQFIKKDLFADEEEDDEEENNEIEIIPKQFLRHSSTVSEKTIRKKVLDCQSQNSPNIIQSCQDNLFSMKEEENNSLFNNRDLKKKAKENEDLAKAKKTMLKIFEEEEDEEKEEVSHPQVNLIEEKTKDLANKLKMMTDENDYNEHKQQIQVINAQQKQINMKKVDLFNDHNIESNEELHKKIDSENQPQFSNVHLIQKEEKKKQIFFEEEDAIKATIPSKKDFLESKTLLKEENISSKPEPNSKPIFSNNIESVKKKITISSPEPNKDNTKKPLAFLNNDHEDTNNIPINKPIIQPQKEIMKENVIPIKNTISPSNDLKPKNVIQLRLDNMRKEEEEKKKSIQKPVIISNRDFNERFSDLQNMLGGRLSSNISNPFVADNNIDTRKKTIDENDQQENTSKQSQDNNESELIESKEEIVIIQKKKPKKKGFILDNNDKTTTDIKKIKIQPSQIQPSNIIDSIPKLTPKQEIINKTQQPPAKKPKGNFFPSPSPSNTINTNLTNKNEEIKEEQSKISDEPQHKKLDFLFDKTNAQTIQEDLKPTLEEIQNKTNQQKKLTSIFDDESSTNENKKTIDQPRQSSIIIEANHNKLKTNITIEPKEEVESKLKFHRNTTLPNQNFKKEQAAKKLKFLFEEDE